MPVIIVSWLEYQQAGVSLKSSAIDKLMHSSSLSAKFIENWFFYRFTDLNSQAESQNNLILLEELSDGFYKSKKSLSDYIKSDDWIKRIKENRNDLALFSRRYSYVYDLVLIDNDGNILYSVEQESDLGSNLFTGTYSSTKFSQAVKYTLETGEDAFSGIERYQPSNNLLTAFITSPILNSSGEKSGVFAIQIKLDVIFDNLSDVSDVLGVSGVLDVLGLSGGKKVSDEFDVSVLHQYLITNEGELRSSMYGGSMDMVLNHNVEAENNEEEDFNPHEYIGKNNKKLIGVRKPIKIKNINWILVSEVESEKAFSSINELAKMQVISVFISLIVIVLMAYYKSYSILRPIYALVKVSNKVASGQTDEIVDIKSNNELGKLADAFNYMLKVRREHEKKLELSKDKIVKALKDLNQQKFALDQHSIVAITDVKGTITFVNDLFENISGYTRDELIGQNHRLLKSGKHDKAFFKDMYNQLTNGDVFHSEICNKAKSGDFYWVDTTIVPYMNEQGKPESYIAIRTDITNQKQTELALIESIKKAEQAVVAKSEFLASMSHEIRTPMNGVLGMLSLLLNTRLDSDQLHRVKVAQSSGQALLTLINDILDFSKIEANKLDLEIIDFNIRGMLGEFAESMAYTAQSKGLELVLDVTKVEQSMVRGDPSRLRQVLTNLVGNAVKFTSTGEIVVQVEIRENGDEQLTVEFNISDTGIGIPEDKLPALFDSFSQVDASTTRKYGGTGLGLAIARKLCILMGGDISAKSVKGKGSTFTFYIQLEKSSQSKRVIPKIDINKLSLLIVDDNVTNCEVLRGQLEHWGATVVEAHSAKQALQICNEKIDNNGKNVFDIAFLDMQMPEMDGEALGEIFISDKRFSDMKLVMMTSMGFQDDVNRFKNIGFSAYFPKPATTSDLFNALAVVIADGSTLQNDRPLVTHEYLQTFTHDDEKEKTNYHWPENTRILLVEDNHVNQLVAQGILADFGLAVDVANNGLEALQSLNAFYETDMYSLILMDCQMPEMDGYETTREIRKGECGENYQDIPIFAMTANAMQGDREKCLDAGMSDYLSKPIDPKKLLKKLGEALSLEINETQNVPVSEEGNDESNEVVIWDKEDTLERLLNNKELFITVIEVFIEEVPERINELKEAVDSGDCDLSSKIVHGLKGVAANVSALQLCGIATELEACARRNELEKIKLLLPELQKAGATVLEVFKNDLANNA